MMADAFLFRVDSRGSEGWCQAKATYLDEPFINTGLHIFYESIQDDEFGRWPLNTWYKHQQIESDKLVKFFEFAGVEREFNMLYCKTTCEKNEQYAYLRQVAGEKNRSPINKDFTLTQRAYDMLKMKTVEGSKLVWTAMCHAGDDVLKANYQKNERGGVRDAKSQLVCWLRDLAWIPLTDGSFVKPSAADVSQLPEGFTVDAKFKWLEAVGFGTDDKKRAEDNSIRAAKRSELGFESEEVLQQAQAFAKLPVEERQRLLDLAKRVNPEPVELPERAARNPELRSQHVGDEARNTPEKTSVQRLRAVQLGAVDAKNAAKVYLKDQYTNSSGQMICQACKGELPFKLPTGAYYFEAVELITDSSKRYREAYLALCPNHAAAYQYANEQQDAMYDLIATADGNEIEIVLGGKETTLYFTQVHLADAKACLNSETNEE
jgi:hypothetical protein